MSVLNSVKMMRSGGADLTKVDLDGIKRHFVHAIKVTQIKLSPTMDAVLVS
jgi:hypothetical protein